MCSDDDDDNYDGSDVNNDMMTNTYLNKHCEYNDNENCRLKQVFVVYSVAFQ